LDIRKDYSQSFNAFLDRIEEMVNNMACNNICEYELKKYIEEELSKDFDKFENPLSPWKQKVEYVINIDREIPEELTQVNDFLLDKLFGNNLVSNGIKESLKLAKLGISFILYREKKKARIMLPTNYISEVDKQCDQSTTTKIV
jgi:hypothetical protein